jgi:hypothetical protein
MEKSGDVHGKEDKCMEGVGRKAVIKKKPLEDLSMDGKITLKEFYVRAWKNSANSIIVYSD